MSSNCEGIKKSPFEYLYLPQGIFAYETASGIIYCFNRKQRDEALKTGLNPFSGLNLEEEKGIWIYPFQEYTKKEIDRIFSEDPEDFVPVKWVTSNIKDPSMRSLLDKIDMPSRLEWAFILNVWLTYYGGRKAYLFEPFGDYDESAELLLQVLSEFAYQNSEFVGLLPERDTQRWLLWNKQYANPEDVRLAIEGDQFALVPLLGFGCVDPEYGNHERIRTSFSLFVSADNIPPTDIFAFICSDNVALPSQRILYNISSLIKILMNSVFSNVRIWWKILSNFPLRYLIKKFKEYMNGLNEDILAEYYREQVIYILNDGEGWDRTMEIFESKKDIEKNKEGILKALTTKLEDPFDFGNIDDEHIDEYYEQIERLEKKFYDG